ncbi:GRIP and coiled-coil domain-containing protein 2-like [Sarcoptes scabiei]|nr:GRIP and coiled-coil domain-containing protein 2-like [Sarcoptes scabiei]
METNEADSLSFVNNEDDDEDNSSNRSSASCFCFPERCCHPSSRIHRYFVLIFMCFLGFGSYYCYDNPGALQKQIIKEMDINIGTFSQLYSWYSWPQTILCFFGGFLIDRVFGIRLGAIIFAAIILIGQLFFALGAFCDLFWVMNFGRFIFGVGGESLAVAQNTYAVSWFKDKELNMVFGLQLSIARAGSTANFMTMLLIYDYIGNYSQGHKRLGFTLLIAAGTCIFSLLCAFILAFFDRRASRLLHEDSLILEESEKVNITDAKKFRLSFWLIALICVTYYVTIFPFTALGSLFFQRKYQISQTEANFYDSIIYVISTFASPVLGILVDLTGRNTIWVLMATIITLISHGMLAFTFIHPLIAMITMGIGYSVLACALWPMVALVIPQNQLGTAYGIMQSVQNLGLACVVLAAGYIVDSKGYISLEIFFLTLLCASVLILIVLFVDDNRKTGGMLNMSPKQRELYFKKQFQP